MKFIVNLFLSFSDIWRYWIENLVVARYDILMAAFLFCSQNVWRRWGTMNGTFSFYESGWVVETVRCQVPDVIEFIWIFLHSEVGGH